MRVSLSVRDSNDMQFEKEERERCFSDDGVVTDMRELHLLNALTPILVMLLCSFKSVNAQHLSNELSGISLNFGHPLRSTPTSVSNSLNGLVHVGCFFPQPIAVSFGQLTMTATGSCSIVLVSRVLRRKPLRSLLVALVVIRTEACSSISGCVWDGGRDE